MLDYVKKEERYMPQKNEEYVVVPKNALDTLMEDYYNVAEGLIRDEGFMKQDMIDEAIEDLDTGLMMEPHQVKSIQTMFRYFCLDDVSLIIEGFLAGTEHDSKIQEITEEIGNKLAHKHIESEYDFNQLVHQLYEEILEESQ